MSARSNYPSADAAAGAPIPMPNDTAASNSPAPLLPAHPVEPATTVPMLDYQTTLEHQPARRGAMRWLEKGSWAIADQALFAGGNFLANIYLARHLDKRGYGAFTVAFIVFLLLGLLHTSLLTEPMLVFGPGRYKAHTRRYFAAMIRGHLLFSVPAIFLMGLSAIACWMLHKPLLASALGMLALTSPMMLLLWLMRRACYLILNSRLAATAGFVYIGLMVAGLLLIPRDVSDATRIATTLGIMGFGSIIAAVGIAWFLRPDFKSIDPGFARGCLSEHVRYGRWAAPAGVVFFLSGQMFYLILPVTQGNVDAAAPLRALSNLIMPMTLAVSGCMTVLGPVFVRARERGKLKVLVYRVTLAIGGVALIHWLILGSLHGRLFTIVYKGRYSEVSHLLWILALLPVANAVTETLGNFMRAREEPQRVFYAFLAAAVLAGIGGTILIYHDGVRGAAIATVACNAIAGLVLLIMCWRERGRTADRPHPHPAPASAAAPPSQAFSDPSDAHSA